MAADLINYLYSPKQKTLTDRTNRDTSQLTRVTLNEFTVYNFLNNNNSKKNIQQIKAISLKFLLSKEKSTMHTITLNLFRTKKLEMLN